MRYSRDRSSPETRAAISTGKLAKGVETAALSVKASTGAEAVVNLNAAKVLGRTVTRSLRLRAPEVSQ
jgi:hypothetical protein